MNIFISSLCFALPLVSRIIIVFVMLNEWTNSSSCKEGRNVTTLRLTGCTLTTRKRDPEQAKRKQPASQQRMLIYGNRHFLSAMSRRYMRNVTCVNLHATFACLRKSPR